MATALSTADEEAIIRNRLLAQITVSKGEPPMRKLCSLYVQFSRAVEQGDKARAREHHAALLQEIAGFEFQARKTAAVCGANRREQRDYERKQAQLESAIEQAHRDIEAKKAELEDARKVRQQNEEFEARRRVCMEQPKRSTTRAEIEKVEQEIGSIQADIVRANQAKELRKKQFALLMHVVNELQAALEDDDVEEGMLLPEGASHSTAQLDLAQQASQTDGLPQAMQIDA